ncbi:anthranilate phosphoribosyltransferase [Nostoc sp. FACHB-892]|uniref:anthranilate phosphoribosyltransferase n=1 Tax=Nostoc sp. FACHB-892 TaxID=2692843 RepID=UPI0016873D09|nr:anthranilate phosphoribosyltransferase [Nostoc sp. FACHB-892]MBD2730947.1 anthranilate phosphoribosyltransferase [Nostoc sp. FACHB-892]
MIAVTKTPLDNIPVTSELYNWPALLQQLFARQSLTVSQAADLMQGWLTDAIPDVLSGAILAAIQAKGVSAQELVGMASVLQSQSPPLVQTRLIASPSSKTCSADVLEALGINLNATPEKVQAAVGEVGITFLFAPGWHPALKAIATLRKTLKVRTVFNLLGPLVNPMRSTGQIIGVNDPLLLEEIVQALFQLGCQQAIAVHGRERLDEAGLADVTDLAVLQNKKVRSLTLNPQELGLSFAPTAALCGGEVQENAEILKAVLQGKGTQAQQDVVALNTALALQVGEAIHGETDVLAGCVKGITLAKEILQSGAAWTKLEQLAEFLRFFRLIGTQPNTIDNLNEV